MGHQTHVGTLRHMERSGSGRAHARGGGFMSYHCVCLNQCPSPPSSAVSSGPGPGRSASSAAQRPIPATGAAGSPRTGSEALSYSQSLDYPPSGVILATKKAFKELSSLVCWLSIKAVNAVCLSLLYCAAIFETQQAGIQNHGWTAQPKVQAEDTNMQTYIISKHQAGYN